MKKIQAVALDKNKVVIGRILPGVDLIEGIQEMCKKNNVEYGVIVTCIGSLSSGCIVYAVPDEDNNLGIRYSEPTYFDGPLELLCCQGIVGKDEDNRFQIHLHGLMGDKNLRIIGGHFLPRENKVLATVEVMIQGVEESEFIRKYDEETGFPLFSFIKKISNSDKEKK